MLAYVADLAFADPPWMPHPVRLFGWLIATAEKVSRAFAHSERALLLAGAFVAFLVGTGTGIGTWLALKGVNKLSPLAGAVAAIYLAYTTLSVRGLDQAGREVVNHLRNGRLENARSSLALIVGRDTKDLDEPEILRAVIESVAENTSDGVVAPLFYLALGGVPAGLAYKAINTMDSMIAHKNERYLYFGRGAARLDDIANFLPARLTALLVTVAAFLLNMSWRKAFHTALRDGRLQPSPNSGYPESAFAGALRIQLGGVNSYDGEQIQKAFIGDPERRLTLDLYSSVRRLLYATSTLMVALSTGIIATLHGVR
jgi:adenosylcobinamide-phosphate synthase